MIRRLRAASARSEPGRVTTDSSNWRMFDAEMYCSGMTDTPQPGWLEAAMRASPEVIASPAGMMR